MALLNLAEMLSEAKRRAQLQGRPISQQETRGITEGFARAVGPLNLQEKGLEESKSQFAQTLAQRKYETEQEMKRADEATKAEKMRGIAGGVAAGAGTIIGGIYGGPGGAAIGSGIGGAIGPTMYEIDPLKSVADKLFGGCIIISSCTSPASYEVQLSREFRDKFLDEQTLTGYYTLCILLVRAIWRWKSVKKFFKKGLVDRLVDYGEWALGKKPRRELWTSLIVTKSFLGLCKVMGLGVNAYLEVCSHG